MAKSIEATTNHSAGTSNRSSLAPEVARDLILNGLDRPTIFRNTIDHWLCRNWNLDKWAEMWGSKKLRFRIGPIQNCNAGPLWEADCFFVEATVADFVEWQADARAAAENTENGLSEVDPSESWVYADYKHLGEIFEENHEIHKVCLRELNTVDWGPFGFVGRQGESSTIWMGSASSQTPCHYDTYGFNLVAQIIGRKQWIMFAPTDTQNLYPTRIPYEESSVFSRVDITNPDVKKFPKFRACNEKKPLYLIKLSTPYIVTLEPGDVLFVPHKWWHFVSSLETSISINSWIETGTDDDCRFEEAVTRTLMSSLMDTYPLTSIEWLNPTEEEVLPAVNLCYVWESLDKCLKNATIPSSAGSQQVEKSTCVDSDNHRSPTSSPQAKKLCKGLRTTALIELLTRYDNIIRVVTPSTFEHLMEQADLKECANANTSACDDILENTPDAEVVAGASTFGVPTSRPGSTLPVKEDRLRATLINSIVDPEVISLICEKFKQSILLESTH